MTDKWTPEQITALRADGQPFRLAVARQTADEKAAQRREMRQSLPGEQLDHVLHLWQCLARELQTISEALPRVHAILAEQIRQLPEQEQHKDTEKNDHESLPTCDRG